MAQNAPSSNVLNLQRRVAGVLPVAIEVPHAGTAFHFVRPLVVDEENKMTFTYKSHHSKDAVPDVICRSAILWMSVHVALRLATKSPRRRSVNLQTFLAGGGL